LNLFLGEGWWSAVVSVCLHVSTFFYENLFSLGPWNCYPKCASVNLHVVHLNIKKNNNVGVFCWVVFSPCLVNVLIRRTYFVMSVVNLPQVADKISIVKKAYELHFGCKVWDLDKSWAPHSCCSRWMRYLRSWLIGTHQSVPLAVPVVWREQKNHCIDCYFCLTKTDGHSSKSKRTIVDPNILQPYDLLNMTIPYQFLSHLNTWRCMKKNQQHLFRRRTWTFRFQCGYWFPATNCTSSYIAVWT